MEYAHTEVKRRAPALTLRPLSAALGAEIIGIDLRQEIDDDVFAHVRDAWHQNLHILLRDQKLTVLDQVRFESKLGYPAQIHTDLYVRSHPPVVLSYNIREDGK